MDLLAILIGGLGGLGGVLAALGTYLVARRTTSGKIATTDADKLWAEAHGIRSWLADEVKSLRAENVRLRARIEELEDEVDNLRRELRRHERGGGASASGA